MKVYQTWKRHEPDTVHGESITIVTTYSSFKKEEIDQLQEQLPSGIVITKTVENDALPSSDVS